jgi:heme-degrading monooxygenase HmoA
MNSGQYAVIFTSKRKADTPEYDVASERMETLMRSYNGFVSFETARRADGFGITVCTWQSLEALQAWKKDSEHREAQERGKSEWYEEYSVRVCKIEYEYDSSK